MSPIEITADCETQVYAAINKDEHVRMQGSSGGVFQALARWTIEQGGVVFGARFNEQWEVVHDYTETIEGIEPFTRSKYVQSIIGNTYNQTKEFLKKGRRVLFVGTPCQIGGLKAYLHKDYDNLLTVDLICHGVPSPGVWRKYIGEKAKGDHILDINFRDKQNGWLGGQCITTTTTNTTTREKQMANPYFRGFIHNLYLRVSCYRCQFKSVHRIADITLADFWGVDKVSPKMHDNKGTSAIFVHSLKGSEYLKFISNQLMINKEDVQSIIGHNSSMVKSAPEQKIKRILFYMLLLFFPFEYVIKISDRRLIVERILNKIKKIFK